MPESACPCCGHSEIAIHEKPFYRHQVHEIPQPKIDITEYRLYSGQCTHCHEIVRAKRPDHVPQGSMGPNLLSHIALLSGQYHLSVRKIQSLLKEHFGTTFSVGAISEAQTKVASMLTPLCQAIHTHLKSAPMVHVDETSHSRNGESRLRWCWLVANDDLVFEKILYSRSTHSAKVMLGEHYQGLMISDQYSSYNWLEPSKQQLCWAQSSNCNPDQVPTGERLQNLHVKYYSIYLMVSVDEGFAT